MREQIIKLILLLIIIVVKIPVSAQDFGKPNVNTSQESRIEQENLKLKGQVAALNRQLRRRDDSAKRNLELDSLVQVLKDTVAQFAKRNELLNEKINDISIYHPLIIKDLKVGNVYEDGSIETAFGDSLYSSASMYIAPHIEYTGLKPGEAITLYTKLYKEGMLGFFCKDKTETLDKSLSKTKGSIFDKLARAIGGKSKAGTDKNTSSSPLDYTSKCDITISESGKVTLTGWRDAEKGYWAKGNYRYEIWYNDMCLKAVNFVIN